MKSLKAKIRKALLQIRIQKELLRLKNDLKRLAANKKYNLFNKLLVSLAERLGILNHQDIFGNILQEVADWKLDLSEEYKKNLMQLGKSYNILGINLKH